MMTKNQYENRYWEQQQLVCGIDEVGRGACFGPVVVSAAILPINERSTLLKDSKTLTPTSLNLADQYLRQRASFAFGLASAAEIDRFNIYQATLLAMRRAVCQLFSICQQLPAALLVDAMPLALTQTAYQALPVYHFPKGEDYSISIAAASILAKVYRDRLLAIYAQSFPNYGLAAHKGYVTKQHQAALAQHGASFLHRQSYLLGAKQQANLGAVHERQTTLFC